MDVDADAHTSVPRRHLSVISANVHALSPRIEEVAAWDADIVLLQETKLAAHAIKDASEVAREHGWRLVHGRPSGAPRKTHGKVKASAEANSGGVATMVRKPRKVVAHQVDKQAADLHDTMRWQEIKTTCGRGGRCLTTANLYGISGSNSNQRRMKQNEALLSDALARLIDADDDPYILMGDFNVTPETSPTIAAAVDAGLAIDVGHLWAERIVTDHDGLEQKCPEPTFCRDGPAPGMEGQGVSRIDVVLANPVAAAAIKDFALRWDLVQVDHVPVQVTLDLDELGALEVVQKTRGLVDTKGLPDRDDPKWDHAMNTAQEIYGPRLQTALDKRDLNEAHVAWNLMAEACLKLAAGWQRSAVEDWLNASPMRGAPPRFVKRQRRKPVDRLGTPTTHRQRRLNNVRNKLLDLRARLKRFDDGTLECTPWGDQRGRDALDFEVKLWDDVEDKLAKLMGRHRIEETVSAGCPGLPTFREIDKLLGMLLTEHGNEGNRAKGKRTAERKSKMKWDWQRNFGRKAFSSTRTDYSPPTFALQDGQKKGRYITSTEAIHDEFLKFWSTVYCAHSEESDEKWRAFFDTYGEYVPHADFQDQPYVFSDYEEQLQRMKGSAAGFDGWHKDALIMLPSGIWSWRAKVDNMAKEQGLVPDAFLHVPTPMLPKGQATTAEKHRGIVIFSYLHRIVGGINWHRLKTWQEVWLDKHQHGGRAAGEYLADAWDLQLRVESARAEGRPLTGALLDYAKFFDMFHPDVVVGLMERSGAPPSLARQMGFIGARLNRYIRVADSFGGVIRQSNGVGQGCSLSIVVANLYVATLFRYLRSQFPDVELAAFLDDRNMTADTVGRLAEAVRATKHFDEAAGHRTNLDKSAAFATEPRDRDALRNLTIRGEKMNVKLNSVMVGHDISVRRARTTTHNTSRTNGATTRTNKIASTMYTRKQKKTLVQQAVIPSMTAGTLWDIPSTKSLDGMRSAIANALWGRGRKQRCREILFGVVHDPTRTDPLAAIVFRRLDDARRLMNKDSERYYQTSHVYHLLKDDMRQGEIFHKDAGPVKGLLQAASLIGGSLGDDERGFFIDFGGTQPRLDINGGANSTWKTKARRAIQNAIIRQLQARLVDPDDPGDQQDRRGKRRDLFGVGSAVDDFATCVHLRGRASAIARNHADLFTSCCVPNDMHKYRYDDIANQRMQATITGSLRAPDRLHKAGLIKAPDCKFCPCACATLPHTTWDCPMWNGVRKPYLDILNAYREKLRVQTDGQRRVEAYDALLRLPCVRNCGVIPEAAYFKKGGATLPQQRVAFGRPNPAEAELTPRQREDLHRDAEGRICAYTDGSAVCPLDPRRRRASWGVHYARDHPWNFDGPVCSDAQTVYRAELTAALHVLESATSPTCLVSDCEAVVDLIRDELDGQARQIKGDHADLHARARSAIASKPGAYFAIRWISSHIPLDLAAEVEDQGGFEQRHIEGNHAADAAAKGAMRWHDIDWFEYGCADDREFVACTVQAMITEIWTRMYDQDNTLRALEEEEEEGDREQRERAEAEQDNEADETQVTDPLTLPNRALARFIQHAAPRYAWTCAGEQDYDEIVFPDLPCDVHYQRRGTQWIKGRGDVNVTFAYPPHYADPVRWWWNRLRWPRATQEEGHDAADQTAAYLECVVDFELTTGFRLGEDGACGRSWAEKARVLAYIVRTLARVHTVAKNGLRTTLQKAVGPRTNATALASLGAPLVSGYSKRPTWLAEQTPEVVAYNVWRARAHERRTCAARAQNYRVRTFAKGWEVDYRGYPSLDAWTSPAVGRFGAALASAKRPRQPADGEGATTGVVASPTTGTSPTTGAASTTSTVSTTRTALAATPTSTSTSSSIALRDHHGLAPPPLAPDRIVTRTRDGSSDDLQRDTDCLQTLPNAGADDHPPPTMTREFKRARINQADDDDLQVAMAPFTCTPSSSAHRSSSSSAAASNADERKRDMPRPLQHDPDGHGEPKKRRNSLAPSGDGAPQQRRASCCSCWAPIFVHGAYALPRGVRWRGVRPGELLCALCKNSFLEGKK